VHGNLIPLHEVASAAFGSLAMTKEPPNLLDGYAWQWLWVSKVKVDFVLGGRARFTFLYVPG